MSKTRRTAPARERRIAPGVTERHSVECPASRRARATCACVPAYRARIRTGPRGEQRTISETFGTLAEAVEWIEDARALQRSGQHPSPRKAVPTLAKAAADFLAWARAGKALNRSGRRYAANTIENYERVLRVHVLAFVSERSGQALKDLPVDAIDTRTMQAMVGHLTSTGSAATARMAEAALAAVLRDLYAREILDEIPSRPTLPAPPTGRDQFLTVEQADKLLAVAANDDAETGRSLMAPLIGVLVATGCRISEALGLVWGPEGLDLNTGSPTVTIARDTTKTEAGARTVGIEHEYAAVLRRHRLATGRPADGALVFADDDGKPLTRDGRVRAGFERVCKAGSVESIGFHVLRHSQGSWLSAAGESATDIAARLGHSDAAFTLRRYVHADRERLADAPAALATLRQRARESRGSGKAERPARQ